MLVCRIQGAGWQPWIFPGGVANRTILDAIPQIGNKPAAFFSADGRSLWVNSAALQRAAITPM